MKRNRLDARKFVYYVMIWSKAFVPVIALLTAFASAVRTFETTRENYIGGGIGPEVATVVSFALTLGVEGAIFILSLAQEGQEIKWRQSRKKRHVFSVKSMERLINERLGKVEPLSYDQMPQRTWLIKLVLYIAFGYALASNFNIGVRPLIEKMNGNDSIQSLISSLINAPATIQTQFFVDFVSILFPPFMAMAAGHLTAQFGAEIVATLNRAASAQIKQPKVKTEQAEVQSERLPDRSESFRKRPSERVIEWMNEHPEIKNQHQIARETGVSIGTVNTVFKSHLSGSNHSGNHNGHGV